MRKLWIALLAVSFAVSGFAQVGVWMPQSFRLQGTSIIEDDFDNAIDPIDIGLVEGSRLYTNLSNLLNYNEQMLANVSQDQYLLGYSGSLLPMMPALKTTILIESKKDGIANFVSITNPPMSGLGFVSGDYTEWGANHKDYEYWSQSKKDETTMSDNVFLFNNLYDLETMKLGARISYLSGKNTWTTDFFGGAPTFEKYYKEYTDDVGKTTDTTAEKGEYSTKKNYSDLGLLFSGAMDMAGMELRGNLNFTMHSENTKPDDHYSWYDDDSPNTDTVINIGDKTETVTGNRKESDMGIGLSGRARKYIEGGYLEAGAGFGMTFSGKIDANIRDKWDKYYAFKPAGGWKMERTYDEYYDYISSGDYSDLGFGMGAKGILPLGEELLLGIGMNFGYSSYKETVEGAPVDYYKYVVDNGDTIAGNEDSLYTKTVTSKEEIETKITATSWNFPVGFEYKFGKKKDFRFRLGALATFTDITEKVTSTNTKPEETVVHAEYEGDKTDLDTTYTEDAYYGTKVEETSTYDQITTYTYGLGWYPTENLQIDLLGFLDPAGDIWTPAFYRNLRLSVTLKFF